MEFNDKLKDKKLDDFNSSDLKSFVKESNSLGMETIKAKTLRVLSNQFVNKIEKS